MSGFKVLVVDDSPVYRKLVEHALSQDSSAVLFATSGHQALEIFELEHPEIIITDWLMPDLTGIELCQRIREGTYASYIYVIILTSNAEKENVVMGLSAGADDYLTKPFHAAELLARVRVGQRLIGLHRQIKTKSRLLEELALTDALTGLPNRRAIETWATRQLSGAARHGFPFWVVMIDLDHFKLVNDAHGHDAGDMVLRKFAEILKSNTRLSDISGRIGGEEFLQVITHADEASVALVLERIRSQFGAEKFLVNGAEFVVTASFGVAGFLGKNAPDFSELVTRADAALYRAKHRGRNYVEVEPVAVPL
ncbi:MAG TPA: diguanylate cyclase [Verrucomicrobiae bacterium]|nr:diguanylate cyclase [Verrucomicrobiae bacterium]